jgi:ribosome-binding protein aMBF1 (putative translation factor)
MSQFDDRGHRPRKDNQLQKAFEAIGAQAKHPTRWETERDSQLFIKDLMREAMEQRGISKEDLAKTTKLPIETIEAFLAGTAELNDSNPITAIERALKVNLSGW